VKVDITSHFPVNVTAQSARGAVSDRCRFTAITKLVANCSLPWNTLPLFIVIEDAGQAWLTVGRSGQNAVNTVTLSISDYTCVKNCPAQ
jgi:hypothetical protein